MKKTITRLYSKIKDKIPEKHKKPFRYIYKNRLIIYTIFLCIVTLVLSTCHDYQIQEKEKTLKESQRKKEIKDSIIICSLEKLQSNKADSLLEQLITTNDSILQLLKEINKTQNISNEEQVNVLNKGRQDIRRLHRDIKRKNQEIKETLQKK